MDHTATFSCKGGQKRKRENVDFSQKEYVGVRNCCEVGNKMSRNIMLLLKFTGMNVIPTQSCAIKKTQNWESEDGGIK